MCTHNLVFEQKKKNSVYPCKPQFYYKQVRFKVVKIIQACFHVWNVIWCSVSHFLDTPDLRLTHDASVMHNVVD